MKTHVTHHLIAALLGVVFTAGLHAQSTAFTYQGHLIAEGRPAEGDYTLRFCLHESPTSERSLWCEEQRVTSRNGLFTVNLGAETGNPLPLEAFSKYADTLCLEVLVERQPLQPRQPLTAAAFALYTEAARTVESVSGGALENGAVTTRVLASGAVTAAKIAGAQVVKSLNALKDDVALVAGANITLFTNGNSLQISAAGGGAGTGWSLTGNAGTAAGVNYVGTSDSQPLELKVNGLRALRFEDNGDSRNDAGATPDGAPNVIGGAPVNTVGEGIVGATISGGGATDHNGVSYPQVILADYATVGGGFGNQVADGSYWGTIAGGYRNELGTDSYYGVLGGGNRNRLGNNSPYGTIAGGYANDVGDLSGYGAIGGGRNNNILNNSQYAIIGGGYANDIGLNSDSSTIGGGYDNNVGANSTNATIAGGNLNDIGSDAQFSAIGGGNNNNIAELAVASTIAGGYRNDISTNANVCAIGGGYDNNLGEDSWAATIAGGEGNRVGSDADYSAIGGGGNNEVSATGKYATIPGGVENFATGYAFAAGTRAKARHTGSFVWADAAGGDLATTANNQFLIRAAGGMGIGTGSPAFALHVNGSAGKPGGGSWSVASDERLKKNIHPVEAALDRLLQLRGVGFEYKDPEAVHELPGERMGLIAQQVESVFPDWVETGSDGMKRLTVRGFEALTVEALRQLREEKDSEIEALKREMEGLKQLVLSHRQSQKGAME